MLAIFFCNFQNSPVVYFPWYNYFQMLLKSQLSIKKDSKVFLMRGFARKSCYWIVPKDDNFSESFYFLFGSGLNSFSIENPIYWFDKNHYLIHLPKCWNRGLSKIKMHHLQTILHLMIRHQLDHWYKLKTEENSKSLKYFSSNWK